MPIFVIHGIHGAEDGPALSFFLYKGDLARIVVVRRQKDTPEKRTCLLNLTPSSTLSAAP